MQKGKNSSELEDLDLKHQLLQWSPEHLWKLKLGHLVVLELREDMKAVTRLNSEQEKKTSGEN